MSNFSFLAEQKHYELFAQACIEAEAIFATSAALCAVGCRKALELTVRFVYTVDAALTLPERDNLYSLVHAPEFQQLVEAEVWRDLPYIIHLGNNAVHTEQAIASEEAIHSMEALFAFVQWVDYSYGSQYEERTFRIEALPAEQDHAAQRVALQEAEIRSLQARLEDMTLAFTAQRYRGHRKAFHYEDQGQHRKQNLLLSLQLLGWEQGRNLSTHVPVEAIDGDAAHTGYADVVLWDDDGKPLAVIEARTDGSEALDGQQQAWIYAEALAKQHGHRPVIFLTDGQNVWFWDEKEGPIRRVSGFFEPKELQRRRHTHPRNVRIDRSIVDREPLQAAVQAVVRAAQDGHRRHLVSMAAGTGKTHVALAVLVAMLRSRRAARVLYVVPSTALADQVMRQADKLTQDIALSDLTHKEAAIVDGLNVTTAEALMDRQEGQFLSPACFQWIVLDDVEGAWLARYAGWLAHFDAHWLGLTSLPANEMDDVLLQELGEPCYVYDYDTAVEKDHVLVPYHTVELVCRSDREGIRMASLDAEDRARYAQAMTCGGVVLPCVSPEAVDRLVMSTERTNRMLETLMDEGICVEGKLGKTVIFAQTPAHASFIEQRFNALYPEHKGKALRRITAEDAYADSLIAQFCDPKHPLRAVVTVDRVPSGLDLPACVNLVFCRRIPSKAQFYRLLGLGARQCSGLRCQDKLDGSYRGKRRFMVLDCVGHWLHPFDGALVRESDLFVQRVRWLAAQDESSASSEMGTLQMELLRRQLAQLPETVLNGAQRRYWLQEAQRVTPDAVDALLAMADALPDARPEVIRQMEAHILRAVQKKAQDALQWLCEQLWALACSQENRESQDVLKRLLQKQTDVLAAADRLLRPWLMQQIWAYTPQAILSVDDPVVMVRRGEAQAVRARRRLKRALQSRLDEAPLWKLRRNVPLNAQEKQQLKAYLPEGQRELEQAALILRAALGVEQETVRQAFSRTLADTAINAEQQHALDQAEAWLTERGYFEDLEQIETHTDIMRCFDGSVLSALLDQLMAFKTFAQA